MTAPEQQSDAREARSHRVISPLLRISLLIGVTIHLAGFLLFRVVSNPLPHRAETRPFVEYVSASSLANDDELEEQAALFDSAPLFIPTRWNASQSMQLVQRNPASGKFPEFEPEINLLVALQPSSLPVTQYLKVDAPIDLLASRFWRFFSDFGQSADPSVAFPSALPVAEVSVVGGVDASLSIPVKLDYTTAVPVSRPVVYYMRVSGSGAGVGAPTLGQSSGNETFDRAAGEWLRLPRTVGQLPGGYLAITVYPW
jgi:hypothetical protein